TSELVDQLDPRSLFQGLGARYGLADGAQTFGISVPVEGHGRTTPVPGFGAQDSFAQGSAPRPTETDAVFPLKVHADGRIERFTASDLPIATEIFGVFLGATSECVVDLGDHDALDQRSLSLSLGSCPLTFAGGLDGVRFALVGIFDPQSMRPNLMF